MVSLLEFVPALGKRSVISRTRKALSRKANVATVESVRALENESANVMFDVRIQVRKER